MRVLYFSLGFVLLLAAGQWLEANLHVRPAAGDSRMPVALPLTACIALTALGAAALAAAYWP